MEGTLLVPPDRGTIIGRAVWKPRYLVIGPQRDAFPSNTGFSQVAARIKDAGSRSSKAPLPQRPQSDAIYLSIYKARDDWEPVQQHSIASITESQVQMIAHRKQGPVLPTLAIQISPDPATDKLRKRRSSRTAGLTTTKDSGPTTLWFRLGDDRTYTLEDWSRYIQSIIQPEIPGRHPISPISPTSPTFINPFAPSVARDYAATSSGSSSKTRRRMTTKSSHHTYGSSREANVPYTFAESASIRSGRSDMSSSHASSMAPVATTYATQHYTTVHPSDLPSPATTVGEYHDQFIEGWTSAQGRSSTLSSPIRARESIGSSPGQFLPSLHSGSPPAPRETILDRAFQLRCIPGSDREVPGEEKLSSIARFEALMRQAEERQRAFEKERPTIVGKEPLKSTWEEDESEDEGGAGEDEEDSDEDVFEQDLGNDEIGPSAQRALHFIANRHSGRSQLSQSSTRTVSNIQESTPVILRPHTAHSRLRPAAQRTSSQPQIPAAALEMSAIPSRVQEEGVTRRNHEKRHSTSDVKRLSFNEFTKRLSGTSSLLLVQTNTSANSSRGSSEIDGAQQSTPPRVGALSPRGGALSPTEREERCRWRGSVGVFGSNEGGFL
ncbi:uncharacterized protein GGS22DRAFT_173184 [Annulohypoxylon maeteangense]|uniref:uncharacterized protein n=1 Tax=Annulohypoxylon maeteangense TaxID=1927788 RepID=UPI002008B058|nr:uncharacterized protein GGS22DRAFT_173184 [Annulohypoxylon maeteangense]KAI0881036.1 hypothetical protein GGS22DRAFT_173184 [Annulohypoxylon maeteangense]